MFAAATEGPLPVSLPGRRRCGCAGVVVSPLMQMIVRVRASSLTASAGISSKAEEERPRGRGDGDWSADGAPRHVCGPDLINSNVAAVSVPLAPLRNGTVPVARAAGSNRRCECAWLPRTGCTGSGIYAISFVDMTLQLRRQTMCANVQVAGAVQPPLSWPLAAPLLPPL